MHEISRAPPFPGHSDSIFDVGNLRVGVETENKISLCNTEKKGTKLCGRALWEHDTV